MPFDFKNEREVFEHLHDLKMSYQSALTMLGIYTARASCYYEGLQWIYTAGRRGSPTLGRLMSNWNPDVGHLRITANRITSLVTKLTAQTEPTNIGFDCAPPPRDGSPEATMAAQVYETAIGAMIDQCGLLNARKEANFKRIVFGDSVVALSIERGSRSFDSEAGPIEDATIKARCVHPTQFVVDPGQNSRDLRDHDVVWMNDVWTVHKFHRQYPNIPVDEKRLKTVGELCKVQAEVSRISDGRLFGQIRQYSKTPGIMVWQGYYKGYSGDWDQMFMVAEAGPAISGSVDGMVLLNKDDIASPFGGDGLGLFKYSGIRRADGAFSISDVWQAIDDQDRLNLTESMLHRWLRSWAGYKIMVDRAALRDRGAEESFSNEWNNQIGGAVFYNSGGNNRVQPPYIAQIPQPPPFISDLSTRYQDLMERQLHRPEVVYGSLKSHVPDRSYQGAIEQADQVGNVRIKEDVREDARLLKVLLGTSAKLAKSGSPSVVGAFRRAGFDEQDFLTIIQTDEREPRCTISVRESSVRNRSPEGRKSDLLAAAQLQAIDPLTLRISLARDLDMALTEGDALMEQQAAKAAARIVAGQQWVPLPLGPDSQFFIDAFRRTIVDGRLAPDAMLRLSEAIQLQESMMLANQAALSPQPADEQPETMSVADALAAASV